MKKKHKILFECIADQETEDGMIPLLTFTSLLAEMSKAAKKFKFHCYITAHQENKEINELQK